MVKFMVTVSYTAEGSRGLTKEGGSAGRAAVKKLVEGLGGKVEASISRTASMTPWWSSTSLTRRPDWL